MSGLVKMTVVFTQSFLMSSPCDVRDLVGKRIEVVGYRYSSHEVEVDLTTPYSRKFNRELLRYVVEDYVFALNGLGTKDMEIIKEERLCVKR